MKRIMVQAMQIFLVIIGLVLLAPIIPLYWVINSLLDNEGEKSYEIFF